MQSAQGKGDLDKVKELDLQAHVGEVLLHFLIQVSKRRVLHYEVNILVILEGIVKGDIPDRVHLSEDIEFIENEGRVAQPLAPLLIDYFDGSKVLSSYFPGQIDFCESALPYFVQHLKIGPEAEPVRETVDDARVLHHLKVENKWIGEVII